MRNHSVSICKAFGIMLMVMVHAGVPGSTVVSLFHMPLFFVMSGYCFKDKYLEIPSQEYFMKKVKTLWWPYVKWSMIFLLLHNMFFRLNILSDVYGFKESHSNLYSWNDVFTHAWHILLTMGDHEYLIVGGYWFMKQIFLGSLMAYVLLKIFYKKWYRLLGVSLLVILMMYSVIFQKKVPFVGIDALTFMSTLLIVLGYCYHKYERFKSWKWTLCFALFVGLGTRYWPVSMLTFDSYTILPYTLTAFCGSIMVFNVSGFICQQGGNLIQRVLVFVGDHTFEILTWHFLCFKLINLLRIELFDYDIRMLAMYPTISPVGYWCILYSLVGIFIPVMFVKLRMKIKQ